MCTPPSEVTNACLWIYTLGHYAATMFHCCVQDLRSQATRDLLLKFVDINPLLDETNHINMLYGLL